MDILLVNPPTLDHNRISRPETLSGSHVAYYRWLLAACGQYNGHSTIPAEHLGLQSLASSLRASGHSVHLLNACVELHASLEETFRAIDPSRHDLVGFTGPLEVFAENAWLARKLRDAGFTGHITFGHDFASLNHELLLERYPEFDSVVRGEGEVTIVELADALTRKAPLDTIKGLSFRQDDRVLMNAPRPVMASLDELPWCSRDDLPKVLDLRMASGIFTQRGCPYHCSFCTTPSVPAAEGFRGRLTWRRRSPKAVVDEMEWLHKEYGLRWLTVVDDLYLAKGQSGSAHALEIAEELLSRNLDLEYMVDCRVDGIDPDVFRQLHRSGLRQVFVGVESGSDTTLQLLQKGYPPEIIRDKLQLLDQLGIGVILGYILWHPQDELQALEASYRFIQDMAHHRGYRDFSVFFQNLILYPGTPAHQHLEQAGLIEGQFPYFSFHFADPWVGALHDKLSGLESLMRPALAEACLNGTLSTKRLDDLYSIMSTYFGQLINCCKEKDETALETTFNELSKTFANAVGSSS